MSGVESAMIAVTAYVPALLAKTTAILACSAAVALAARRASAARRHLLWLCALMSCASLVVLTPLAKRIVVPVPSFIPMNATTPFSTPRVGVPGARGGHDGIVGAEHSTERRATTSSSIQIADSQLLDSASMATTWPIPRLTTVALMVWLAGFLCVVLRFAWAYRTVIMIVRRSRALDASARRAMLAGLTDRADIAVRISGDALSPFTIGVRRPTIVLSTQAEAWSDGRRNAVLRHEIAHIERGDVAAQSIGLFVCALLWFHPLVWFALAQLRRESESAADDRVISAGFSSIGYASHLVEIARAVTDASTMLPLAVGIGTPPFERRILAMLDRTRSRRDVSQRTRLAAVSVAMSVMIPIGGLEFSRSLKPATNPTVATRQPVVVAPPVTAPSSAAPVPVPVPAPVSVESLASIVDSSSQTSAVDSIAADSATVARPGRVGAHPDLSGIWALAGEAFLDTGGVTTLPNATITQTPTRITWAIARQNRNEYGQLLGVLHALFYLEDGAPAQGTFASNGRWGRTAPMSISWEGDTLIIRGTSLSHRRMSGSLERIWLTADGGGLVDHQTVFGDQAADHVDTLWRRTARE